MENIEEENVELEVLEENLLAQDDANDLPPSDIVAFTESRSCADLYRMWKDKQLDIKPDYQRDVVWSISDQTRFIDSLTKQLPIPSICISLDYKTDKRLVIDGLQRITSIIRFLDDDEFKLSDLPDIDERLAGKTIATIKSKSKTIYDRVQNTTIPVTVIRCDTSKKDHNEYLFTIFHRLNTGGIKLNNQEIRNCIYSGSLNDLLKKLADSILWKNFINYNPQKKYRFANEELILRFFAFYDKYEFYTGKLSKFLNDYMNDNRNLKFEILEEKELLFNRTIALIYTKILDSKASNLSKTVTEGLLFSIAKNIETLELKSENDLKKLFRKFLSLEEFSFNNLKEGLSTKEKVKNRLGASLQVFGNDI